MPTLVLDQLTIEKLKAVSTVAEVRDEKGVLWGYFYPVGNEQEGGGRPLADILRDVRKLP